MEARPVQFSTQVQQRNRASPGNAPQAPYEFLDNLTASGALQSGHCNVCVKAIVSNVLDFVYEDQLHYELLVMLDDGTGSVKARFADQLTASLAERSCSDLNRMPDEDRMAQLGKLEEVLAQLEGIFTLEPDNPVPIVTALNPPTRHHAWQLLRRIQRMDNNSY